MGGGIEEEEEEGGRGAGGGRGMEGEGSMVLFLVGNMYVPPSKGHTPRKLERGGGGEEEEEGGGGGGWWKGRFFWLGLSFPFSFSFSFCLSLSLASKESKGPRECLVAGGGSSSR